MPDGQELVYTKRVNPEMPIPAESTFFHGITDADVKDFDSFKIVGQEVADFIADADLAGYNSNKFDVPMLMEEFLRAGIDFSLAERQFVDVQNIFHQMEQRTLKAAYKFYCNAELTNAHSAEADVRATYEVLKAQLDKYEGVSFEDKQGLVSTPVVNDVQALHQFTNLSRPVDFAGRLVFNEEGQEVINFGKHKGKLVVQVFEEEPSYYGWMQHGDFPLYTKKCLENIWIKYKSEKKVAAKSQPEYSDAQRKQAKQNFQKTDSPKEKAKPITLDMLKDLQGKFGK